MLSRKNIRLSVATLFIANGLGQSAMANNDVYILTAVVTEFGIERKTAVGAEFVNLDTCRDNAQQFSNSINNLILLGFVDSTQLLFACEHKRIINKAYLE